MESELFNKKSVFLVQTRVPPGFTLCKYANEPCFLNQENKFPIHFSRIYSLSEYQILGVYHNFNPVSLKLSVTTLIPKSI